MILIVTGLMTEETVSCKSNLACWWNPLATKCPLYLLIVSSRFSLILKAHLQLIACLFGGRGTRDQQYQVMYVLEFRNSICVYNSKKLSCRIIDNRIIQRGKETCGGRLLEDVKVLEIVQSIMSNRQMDEIQNRHCYHEQTLKLTQDF